MLRMHGMHSLEMKALDRARAKIGMTLLDAKAAHEISHPGLMPSLFLLPRAALLVLGYEGSHEICSTHAATSQNFPEYYRPSRALADR